MPKETPIRIPLAMVKGRSIQDLSTNGLPVISVDGRSKWKNPWRAGRDGTYEECFQRYKDAIRADPPTMETIRDWVSAGGDLKLLVRLCKRDPSLLGEIRGHNLACWCPLDKPCHAAILLKLANKFKSRMKPKKGKGH